MEKFFQALSKPAKWIFIVGGFFYAAWFATITIVGIGNNFLQVIAALIILSIGVFLLVAAPILSLLGKVEPAKMVFLFLLGYWVLSTIQNWLVGAAGLAATDNGLAVTSGIFMFIAGLGVVAILILVILELMLKKPALRLISLIVFVGIIVVGFIAALLLFILYAQGDAVWPTGLNNFVQFAILPIVICFGYLYFFGAPAKKN